MDKETYNNLRNLLIIHLIIVLIGMFYGFRWLENKDFDNLSKRCWKSSEEMKTTDGNEVDQETKIQFYKFCMKAAYPEEVFDTIRSIDQHVDEINEKLD